jgi:ubiquinone/menaquinone biosynthesis C-methylase UbiE
MNVDLRGAERAAISGIVELDGKRVLEVGFGDGHVTRQLIRPDNHVVAIDSSRRFYSRVVSQHPEVNFQVGNFFQMSKGHLFDLVVFARSLHHFDGGIDGMQQALNMAADLLAANGQCLVVEPSVSCDFVPVAEALRDERTSLLHAIQAVTRSRLCVTDFTSVESVWQYTDFEEFSARFLGVSSSRDYPTLRDLLIESLGKRASEAPLLFTIRTNLFLLH